jgi:tetratricopeptide (TPR) repeat protein
VLFEPPYSARQLTAGALALLAALACALYLPYLHNPLVFDDRLLFTGLRFADHATAPLGAGLRFPAYFSINSVHVIFGSIGAHRIVGLLLHVGVAWALYGFIRALAIGRFAAFAAAAVFALHPASVYGAGYLAQRAIVMATLFSLLALLMFVRGLRSGSYSDIVPAALLYLLAVLSKEHAVLLPAVALALVPQVATRMRFALGYSSLFLAACLPAAIMVVVFVVAHSVIGRVYEPQFGTVAAQVVDAPWTAAISSPWLGSAVTQAALFFRYLFVWFLPSTSEMSLDLRVDFASYWQPAVALPAVFCFLASGALAAYLVLRRGRWGVAAFGFLYAWILFLIEFSTVRFQEPFVLYRSYLWAPGFAVMLAAAIPERLPGRWPVAALALVLAVLGSEARDRLTTFSSGLALWEDAVAKLPAEAIPGGHRPLYELGREYLYAGRAGEALTVTERCTRQYPRTFDCVFAQAAIQLELEQYEQALPSIGRALAMRPDSGVAHHHLGFALENLGCLDQAKAEYRTAVERGFGGAQYRLERLESPGKGLLAPGVRPRRAADCGKLLAKSKAARPG